MADENQEQVEQNEPTLTPTEQRAMEQGWVPQEQWEGDPDAWRPAKEFLDRGELFKKIDDQNRTIKEFKKVIEDLKRHNSKVEEAGYKRALEDLKAQKKEALLEGDADAVVDIDEKIAVVREAQKDAETRPEPVRTQEQQNEALTNWISRNAWYKESRAMRAFADRVGVELGASGDLSVQELLTAVEKEVKKEFPEKFQNPNRAKAPAVESGSNKASGKRESFTLTDDERRVMNRIVRTGVMTEKEYIEQYKKIQGV